MSANLAVKNLNIRKNQVKMMRNDVSQEVKGVSRESRLKVKINLAKEESNYDSGDVNSRSPRNLM
jgi:hypothetical protein